MGLIGFVSSAPSQLRRGVEMIAADRTSSDIFGDPFPAAATPAVWADCQRAPRRTHHRTARGLRSRTRLYVATRQKFAKSAGNRRFSCDALNHRPGRGLGRSVLAKNIPMTFSVAPRVCIDKTFAPRARY